MKEEKFSYYSSDFDFVEEHESVTNNSLIVVHLKFKIVDWRGAGNDSFYAEMNKHFLSDN